jgi:outer membrane protein TolC
VSLSLLPQAALAAPLQDAPAAPPARAQAPVAAEAPARRPLTLAEVLASARANNTDVAVLEERIAQADALSSRARAALLPSLNANVAFTLNGVEAVLPFADPTAGYTQQPRGDGSGTVDLIPNRSLLVTIQPRTQLSAGAQLAVPLVVVPAWLGIKNAQQAHEAVTKDVERARQALLSGIAQTYLQAVSAQRLVTLARTQLETAQAQERIAQVRYQAGAVPKIAALRTGVDLARARQQVRQAENGYATARLVLQQLAGLKEDFDVVPPAPVAPPPGEVDALVEQALATRPDLAASRMQVDIAERAVRSTKWEWAPTIAAVGSAQWTSVAGLTGQQANWLAQVTASFSLFDGGRYARLREGRSRVRQASAASEGLRRQVEREVRTAVLNLQTAQANLAPAQEQERLAVENASLVDTQFRAGAATYLDVVDANTVRFAAGVASVSEELGVQTATLRLLEAMGLVTT